MVLSNTTPNLSSNQHSPSRARGLQCKAIIYMLLGQALGAIVNVLTKLLETGSETQLGMDPLHILSTRMSITCFLLNIYMWWKEVPHFPLGQEEVRLPLLIRGVGGFTGVYGMYYSLQYLPLEDATVITFLAPGIACWAYAVLFKESFTYLNILATLIALLGVALIPQPTLTLHTFR